METARIDAKRGRQHAFLPEGSRRGRQYIFVDEWGPYDFTDIRLWPRHVVGGGRAEFQLLAPAPTEYRVTATEGAIKVAPRVGVMPQHLTVSCVQQGIQRFSVALETNEKPLRATGVLLCADWDVAFYPWPEDDDPREGDNWSQIIARTPVRTFRTGEVRFAWGYRGPAPDAPVDRFATVAQTAVELPAGRYRLATISDDGVRVLVNERTVLSNWTHHGPTRDEATVQLEAGRHTIRIEHFEIAGYACLKFRMEPFP